MEQFHTAGGKLCWTRSLYFCVIALVVFGLFSSVASREIRWEDHVQNDLVCVGWDVK